MGHYCWCLNQSLPKQSWRSRCRNERDCTWEHQSISASFYGMVVVLILGVWLPYKARDDFTLIFVDGDKLCILEYYIMMTISFVVFKLLAQPSLTSCMVNLHSQHIFVEMRVPSYIQHLHVLSLSAVEWYTHSFIIHIFSFFIYYSQAIILIS